MSDRTNVDDARISGFDYQPFVQSWEETKRQACKLKFNDHLVIKFVLMENKILDTVTTTNS